MKLTSALIWALAALTPTIQAAVLAIDYGAEFTKLSLVKPGVPFDVVLDRDSKRKISSVVGWKRDDRVFGADGKMAATRFPDTHYPYIKPLLAQTSPSSLPIYPSSPSLTNNTLYFPHPSLPSHITPAPSSSSVWSPPALLAHQLAYFRALAESLASAGSGGAKEVIKDVIVTVPAWWNQHQRRSYRDALELQGLTCLAMMGEGTAVGLNFAMTRSFPTFDPATGEGEKEYHVVYDSGALSTTATVLAFYQTSVLASPKSKTLVNTTHVEVMGTGWAEVGGVHLDVAVQQLLVDDFEMKSKKKVNGDKKALAKLAKEAVRVKQILSANQESNVAIESVLDDIDYRSRLSRTSLESSVSPLLPSFSTPLSSALSAANLSIDSITSILLFGGNTRVPLVQAALKETIESLSLASSAGSSNVRSADDIIAQNVNTDEAGVLGAAFYGAGLSRQFRMKSVEVHEKTVFDYAIRVNGEEEVVFGKGTEVGERKGVALRPEDQVVEVLQDGKPVFNLHVTEVAPALANYTTPEPFLNLTLRLDHRGHIAAVNAAIVSNVIPAPASDASASTSEGVAGALKGLFGKKDAKDGDATVEGEEEEEKADEAKEGKDSKKSKKEKKEKEKREKDKREKREKVVVKFRETYPAQRPMGGEEKRSTAARLSSIAAFENAKHAREEARNALEGYLYRLQALLDPSSDNKALEEFATKDEREAMKKAMGEAFEWLAEEAEVADEASLRKKRTDIEKLEAPVIYRYKQSHSRPKSVDDFQQAMFAARAFFVGAQTNQTTLDEAHANATAAAREAGLAEDDMPTQLPPRYTADELNQVGDKLKELEAWMNERMEKQVMLELDKTADPVVSSEELDKRGKALQKMVLDLQNRKPPKATRVKVKASTTASSSTTSPSVSAETATGSSAEDGEQTAPPRHEEL